MLNDLGDLLRRSADRDQARDRDTQALAIARAIGASLQEAQALEGIGQCHLQDANPVDAAADLQQALALYQRIGAAPGARRVHDTLRHHTQSADPPPTLLVRTRLSAFAWRSPGS